MVTGPEVQKSTCSNPDCRIAEDGRCIEGFEEPTSCSHFGRPLIIIEANKPDATKPAARSGVRLPSADALPAAAAQVLMRSTQCIVVALVGPHESGKTSLMAGVYDLLQADTVGNYAFAGSTTLHAFERACHDARTASNRREAHMERTERGPATYLHLDLMEVNTKVKRSALFANRDGEAYMDTQVNPELAVGYPELRRCDTLTVLADGMKLLDDSERHQVLNDVCHTIRAFEEAGQTRSWQRLAIVLTKMDAVRKAEDPERSARAIRQFERIVSEVRDEFSDRFAEIQPFPVSASPKGDAGERGEGMQELLTFWMREPYLQQRNLTAQKPLRIARAFGRLRPAVTGGSNG